MSDVKEARTLRHKDDPIYRAAFKAVVDATMLGEQLHLAEMRGGPVVRDLEWGDLCYGIATTLGKMEKGTILALIDKAAVDRDGSFQWGDITSEQALELVDRWLIV